MKRGKKEAINISNKINPILLNIIDNIITIIILMIFIFITTILNIPTIVAIIATSPFVVWAVRANENFRQFFKIFYPPYFSS